MRVTQFFQAVAQGLSLGALYALLGIGFVVIFKATGVVSLALPALMIFGAYWASVFTVSLGWVFWIGMIAAVLLTALLASAIERIAMRPMVGQPVFAAIMVTVGLDIFLRSGINRLMGVGSLQIADPWGLEAAFVRGVYIPEVNMAIVVIAGVVIGGLLLFFKYSRFGLAMRATALDQEASMAQGINIGGIFAASWLVAGGLAALAGVLVSSGGTGFDQQTAFLAIKALPAIILGGLDSIGGALVGAAIIGIAEALSATYQPQYAPFLGANFHLVLPYLILLVGLLIRPYGIFGTREIERV